ncbi:MAG: glycoside hydrolase family 97 protein [Bacteroidales bacterium]|nr:glycoside hydrolase family 97 protein [Bacteroidales bacterium]
MKTFLHLLFMFFLVLFFSSCDENESSLKSPSGDLNVEFEVSEEGLLYSIEFKGEDIIDDSPLGLEFNNMDPLTGLGILEASVKEIDESWERVWGKSKSVRNHCNEMFVSLQEKEGQMRKLNIIFRAYDDGVAFRYQIPEQEKITDFELASDQTQFVFAEDHTVWATNWGTFKLSQEKEFNEVRISEFKPEDIIGTPLLIKAGEYTWVAILEANLTDWAGMCLGGGTDPNSVRAKLSPYPDDENVVVKSTAPRYSPWRVVMIADHPGRFIESDIIHNLNEPCALDDVSWIEPGKCAWDWWWSDGYAPDMGRKLWADTDAEIYFVDFASEMGWEYQLVDWNWYGPPFTDGGLTTSNPDVDITKYTPTCVVPEIAMHAKAKGVKTIVWLEWHHANNQMDEAFPLYEDWGIEGVKIDFMDRNDQEMVNFYHRAIKKAAEHHLVVDFHGAYMPTGIDRTYPNFITREGVLGNEYNKWSDRITPDHCLTIPFTRMLGGQMDFTPGGFVHGTRETFKVAEQEGLPYTMVRGTRCFQLAMFVVYESALQVICDAPYNYRNSPAGLDFINMVPTSWDETRVLNGEVGDYITIARRSGDEWYIGCMTDWTPRELEIPLDFLGEGRYTATVWSDAPDADQHPEKLIKNENGVTGESSLNVSLAPAGGTVIHLLPIK